jgi:ABC-type antimicrobial peptide transport system permease subunit
VLLVAWRNVWRHKVRSAFLSLCVVIGVAFVADTYVLTDTIKGLYSQMFDDAYQGVDLSVPYSTLLVVAVIITIAGVIASIFPAVRVGRLNVLRAIATE